MNMTKEYNTYTRQDLPFKTRGVILYRDKNMQKWRPLPYRIANLMYRGYLCLGGKGNIVQLSTLFRGNQEYYDTLELYNSDVAEGTPAVQFTELITYFLVLFRVDFFVYGFFAIFRHVFPSLHKIKALHSVTSSLYYTLNYKSTQ